jgi:hypothetical protein
VAPAVATTTYVAAPVAHFIAMKVSDAIEAH